MATPPYWQFFLLVMIACMFMGDALHGADFLLIETKTDGRTISVVPDTLVHMDDDLSLMIAITNYPKGLPANLLIHSVVHQMYMDCAEPGWLSLGRLVGYAEEHGEGSIILKQEAIEPPEWHEHAPGTGGFSIWTIGCGL